MAKFGTLDISNTILQAIRDNKLVIFAGAGVSMGQPSNLPSFETLANDIAKRTGLEPQDGEPFDRFLGRLQYNGVKIKERALEILTKPESLPNRLHSDLLRLFQTKENIRLVTTNFDRHFETAASALYGELPSIYRAPALPLGYNFNGIVYIHGSVTNPQDIVLCDADFGRAYLTEGWACRFLLDVFRNNTVLFVGYSHTDVVMSYLSRALPVDYTKTRFIITDDDRDWGINGITPILFAKCTSSEPYSELYDGIHKFADIIARGSLDWRTRLAEISRGTPPVDDDTIGEIELALSEDYTTRFLLKEAKNVDWPKWFDSYNFLDKLFQPTELRSRDRDFAYWLVDNYVIENPDTIFELMIGHGSILNPFLWEYLCHELGNSNVKRPTKLNFERWLTILLANIPNVLQHHSLLRLAEYSLEQDTIHQALMIFLIMGKPKLIFKRSIFGDQLDVNLHYLANQWELNRVWMKLSQHFAIIAQPLLTGYVAQIEDMHKTLVSWGKSSRDWDSLSYHRAAIEPHGQDRYPRSEDVMLDAARDSLQWLAENNQTLFLFWIENLVTSDAPLLRRLAVHAVTIEKNMSEDERIEWILSRIGVHGHAEHHELFRAIAMYFSGASENTREKLVRAVLAYRLPGEEGDSDHTEYFYFNWLTWLLKAMPDYSVAQAALVPIVAKHPNWQVREYQDLTHWMSSGGRSSKSPWTVDQLLSMDLSEKLEELMTFKGDHFSGPDRDGLLETVRETCKQSADWALTLAELLSERSLWASDIWSSILLGIQESSLSDEKLQQILAMLEKPELINEQAYSIARILLSIVKDGDKPYAMDLLEQANTIAVNIWRSSASNEPDRAIEDWQQSAINHTGGVITEFWVNSLSIIIHEKSVSDRVMPEMYKRLLTEVVEDQTIKGGLGRSFLASQIAFLYDLDEAWTCEFIVPLFTDTDRDKFNQAWDGFLVWGRLNETIGDVLLPAFISAIARLNTDLHNNREHFIESCTTMAVYYDDDPMGKLLPELFKNCSVTDRITFSRHLGFYLQNMTPDTIKTLWHRWLHHYWRDRLNGVPTKLAEEEVVEMLEWLGYLGELYPEAVKLAISFGRIKLMNSMVLYELQDSELVIKYPNETCELLLYLCTCDLGFHSPDLVKIAKRLSDLPPELKVKLDDGIARLGL